MKRPTKKQFKTALNVLKYLEDIFQEAVNKSRVGGCTEGAQIRNRDKITDVREWLVEHHDQN